MIDPLISLALATGLLGSGHCLGMCGSLVAALALSDEGRRSGLLFQVLYHAGRLLTYAAIGLLAGWLGSAIAYVDAFSTVTRVVLVGSDLFVILVGLGSAGLLRTLNIGSLEFGAVRPPAAAVHTLRRLPPGFAAFPLGLLFGLLPCGFVYAMALSAAQSASAARGAALMFAFGLGSVPALLLFGGAAQWLGRQTRTWMLRGAGLTVALMGVYNLCGHLRLLGG
jgi:sulfite exporter TauE/SafE